MTRGSQSQSRNFTINYAQRLSLGGEWLGSLDVSVQSWRHTISSFGGFDTAEFDLVESDAVLDDWFNNGLGRAITVYDDTLFPVWEGYVNSVTVNQGGLSVTRGPLNALANRVFAIYSGIDTTVYPPTVGVRKRSPTVNDTVSQALWGIWPKIVSLAGVSDANADRLVSMYLQEHSYPEKDSNFAFSKDFKTVTVSCSGWYTTLNYPYNQTITSGTVNLSGNVQTMLAAQPNLWISSDYSRVNSNTTPVVAYLNDDRVALEYLRGYAAMGDAALNRYMFGVYEDRKAVYEPVSNTIDYLVELGDPQRRIYDNNHSVVSPWRVRPGKWVFYTDFLPGLGAPFSNFAEDPRMLLVEQVEFDLRIPHEVHFKGGKNSKYEQKSAQLGLRGTSV